MKLGYDSICCFRGNRESYSRRACWEITTACNLSCGFCHRPITSLYNFDIARLDDSIDLFRELNLDDIIISGGEPFLHPYLFKIINALHMHDFSVDLCTNGTILTTASIKFLKEHLQEISISIDSYLAIEHDTLRGCSGAWDLTIKNIKKLIYEQMIVHTISLFTMETIKHVNPIVKFLADLGVSSISFIGLIPLNAGKNDLLSKDSQIRIFRVFENVRNKFPDISINTKQIFLNGDVTDCKAGHTVLGIDADLNIFPCLLKRQTNLGINSHKNKQIGCCPGSSALVQRGQII